MVPLTRVTAVLVLFAWAAKGFCADTDFEQSVGPILTRRCLECHSGAEPKGGLDLTRREKLLAGGETGPALVPGEVEKSLLWQRITADEMPPKKPLSQAEKDVLRQWIAAGAAWGKAPLDLFRVTTDRRAGYDWWAFQPLASFPAEASIDSLIAAKLRQHNLAPSPPADRRTLIRRLTFDLIGLPPTPEEVQEFEQSAIRNPQSAIEALVDRLLASPQYGVRWARHWLDVVRFGESQGFERDKLRDNSWPYRDWVVDALNADLPYDEFARRQIAGDVLWPKDPQAAIATGFLVAGPYDEVGKQQQSAAMKAVVRQDELEDLVSVVGQTFLGLTVNCARCHDHKFDPVRQQEYYQLAAALDGVQHGTRDLATPEARAEANKLDQQIASLQKKLKELGDKEGSVELKGELAAATQARGKLQTPSVYAVAPQTPGVSHMLLRGNPASKGPSVSPGGIAAVHAARADFHLSPDAADADRRRKLSEWIASGNNPLFARVIVNRVWHYHFGVGLVDTPNDFGFNGGRPSHPELIDFLAVRLIASGWSLKSLHGLIVTSAAYRQSSTYRAEAAAIDAGNRLLWRKSIVRLEAEALRDATLSVAGQLNLQMGGPGYRDFTTYVHNTQFYQMQDPIGPEFQRRSIYRTWIRSGRSALLDVFDCPDPSTKTPQRAVTITPLQALALMNNSFILRMSQRFAERLTREAGNDVAAQIQRGYKLAFNRDVDDDELETLRPFVAQHGLAELCRILLNSNEFLYVD